MKKMVILFLFIKFIKITFSIVPLWNFEKASQNLLKDGEYYYTFDGPIYGTQKGSYSLTIKVSKNENGIIMKEKFLYLDGNQITGMDYDEIESVYKNNKNNYFVCPKGKFFVYFYNINDPSKNKILQNGQLDDKKNWDLKCFYQENAEMLFISHLNSGNRYYEYILDEETFKNSMKLYNGLYAFKWQITPTSGSKIPMYAVVKSGEEFVIKYFLIDVQKGQSFGPDGDSGQTWKNIPLKSKYLAFFRNDESTCYFINYNDANDFQSGYSNKQLDMNNFDESDITINNDSPFKFVDKITINEIQFIYDTQYVYYNITNMNKNKFYYGIIDIKLNKIIFNTDEDFIEFKPLSTAIFAKTKNSAYKICPIFDGNNYCPDNCWNDPIFDSTTYNNCGSQCSSSFILEPDKICVDECNENIQIKEGNKCWLCKDKNDKKKFKLINFSQSIDCLEKKPNNSEYINENLYLVACSKGFDLFEDNNCVKSCSNGHYKDNQICKKCNINCQTCENTSDNCTTCKSGEYLDKTKLTCNNCSENCETCSNGEEGDVKNCLTCKKNTDFKYLYNKNCVKKCPNGTIASSKDECIDEKKKENSNEDNVRYKNTTMLFIFMAITGILLITIIICFYKKVCYKPMKSDESLINEINTELIDNKDSVN